jgi:hypothetical protein
VTAINPVHETFLRHRDRLEREHRGKHALVSSNEIVGIFDTVADAELVLRARFSEGPMIVYHIGHTK